MPCRQGLLARPRGQANLPKRMIDIAGHLGLAFKIGQRADIPIGSLAPAMCAISGVRKLPPADSERRLPSLRRLPSSLTELPIGRARSSHHSAWSKRAADRNCVSSGS
jgi:hypothetical protein